MPASAEREAVEREVEELERLCKTLEEHLVAGNWESATGALRDSRRVTHAYLNAMEAAATVRDEAFDRSIHERLRRIFDVREDQLVRLRAYHAGVGERLTALSRWKQFARGIGANRGRSRSRKTLGLDSTR
ncbi:MAG TPA: hypothetical protein VKR05_01850 [Candidatus Cybelea sp.]|nr:hypothetical protein [Candidatus Cybelea sp.]